MSERPSTSSKVVYLYKQNLIYITPTEKKNETRLFIFIYLKTMF
jgi:hypothetical protein